MELPQVKTWIEKKLGPTCVARGLEYCREGRISIVDVSDSDGHHVIRGTCRGSVANPYVVWASTRSSIIEDAFCSCPIGSNGDCKHVAALLFDWKLGYSKSKPETLCTTTTPRTLHPGPFSSTLLGSPKESKNKPSKLLSSNFPRKKSQRSPKKSPNGKVEDKPKLNIIGFEDDEDILDEAVMIKLENEYLRSRIERLTMEVASLRQLVHSNEGKKTVEDGSVFDIYMLDDKIEDDKLYISPTKKHKSANYFEDAEDLGPDAPIDRAIRILFQKEDDSEMASHSEISIGGKNGLVSTN